MSVTRILFACYLGVIVLGLLYFTILGLLGR